MEILQINAHGDSTLGSVRVEAVSPSGRIKKCEVIQKANLFTATFAPNEVGGYMEKNSFFFSAKLNFLPKF